MVPPHGPSPPALSAQGAATAAALAVKRGESDRPVEQQACPVATPHPRTLTIKHRPLSPPHCPAQLPRAPPRVRRALISVSSDRCSSRTPCSRLLATPRRSATTTPPASARNCSRFPVLLCSPRAQQELSAQIRLKQRKAIAAHCACFKCPALEESPSEHRAEPLTKT